MTAAAAAPSTARLDMSLDDLIRHNKSARRGDVRPARRGAPGIMRSKHYGPRRSVSASSFRYRQTSSRAVARTYRPSPYGLPSKFARRATSDQGVWQHDMFDLLQRPPGIETGTKLYVSNLDYGVSADDIKELFSEVGDLKRCSIHYDPSGRSKGTAEVVYSRKVDGIAALKRYNNVQLDGKSMKIEFIGSNLVTPTGPSSTTNGSVSNRFYARQDSFRGQPPNRQSFGMGSRGRRLFGGRRGIRGRGRSGRGGRGQGRGQGQGGGRGQIAPKSAADLDAELAAYHSDAMQT